MSEELARALLSLRNIMEHPFSESGEQPVWFISFGALRYYASDRLLGMPFNQDIDVSMMYGGVDPNLLQQAFMEFGYMKKSQVLNNRTKQPFQMVFAPEGSAPAMGTDIDIFFWVKANGYYWHTYDPRNTGKEILDSYVFKGIKAECFDAGVFQGTWEDTADKVNFPIKFGQCLDVWYPPERDSEGICRPDTGWIVQQKNYGQSRTDHSVAIVDCKDMEKKLK